ncbi:putative transferase [Tanacetum coccineum]
MSPGKSPSPVLIFLVVHHKMGFKDEVVAAINVRLILFYSTVSHDQDSTSKFLTHLENSLAQCLSRLYPLASRYNHHIQTIKCNDEGAEFIQARVLSNVNLQDILDPKLNPEILNNLLPCGVSHKVADAATLCIFLNDWAALAREDIIINSVCPSFNSSVFLPPRGFMDYDRPLPQTLQRKFENKYKTKRFSFSEKAISLIRAKTNSGRIYSMVQLVSAMIWKALIDMDQEKLGHARASVLHQPVNLRGKTTPPIPNDACGNLGGFIITQCSIAQKSMGFACLLDLLHDSIKKIVDDLGKLSSKSEEFQTFVFN